MNGIPKMTSLQPSSRQTVEALTKPDVTLAVSVIVPTYNEAKNIAELIRRIDSSLKHTGLDYEILVVDDSSPDRTAEVAFSLTETFPVRVIRRSTSPGLSRSVVFGINAAQGDLIVVMDADLSHPPEDIPLLLKPLLHGQSEMTIGTRYLGHGATENWPLYRRFVSISARLIARPVTGISDPTSGYFAITRDLATNTAVRPIGWKIALEYLARSQATVREIPFTFTDRKEGNSKLRVVHALAYVVQIINLTLVRLKNSIKALPK